MISMSFFNDPERISESYGVKIAGGLIVFFLAMKISGFVHVVELRLFNVIILAGGVFLALRKFKQTHADHMNYFRGLITGVATGAIGSLIFAIFLFIYMKADQSLMDSIIANDPMGRYLNAYISAFIVALEGVFSGLLVTFVLLNWVNTDDVNDPAGESR